MWKNVKALDCGTKIVDLFESNANRAGDFSVNALDMLFDYSKTSISEEARTALIDLANAAGVTAKRDAMFAGEKINETEGRAVLHTALRNLSGDPVVVDGVDVMPEVHKTLDRMAQFSEDIRKGRLQRAGWRDHRCREHWYRRL